MATSDTTAANKTEDVRLRGEMLSFSQEPSNSSDDALVHNRDAVIHLSQGKILSIDSAATLLKAGDNLEDCVDLRDALILPGFIDTHIHYPQMDIIGGYGAHLLEWLDRYAFPAEIAYADEPFAAAQAEQFMRRLFQHGTTTALTFTTVHSHTTDALFTAAERHNARMIAGKVLMNRNAPAELTDQTDGIKESDELIQRWHQRSRLAYAVTPRFAITCTDAQLGGAAELLEQHKGVYLHTHLAEDHGEIKETMKLFPQAKDYVDVYDRFNLLGERSVFAHGIHLAENELDRLAETNSGIAFCPTSNLFLGSGLLNRKRLRAHNVRMSVATDVGGGTSFSLLRTLGDGYKVGQLNDESWHPYNALHAITRGNAIALGLGDKIGQIKSGFEADLTVVKPPPQSMLGTRLKSVEDPAERLFAAYFLAGDDSIARTYVNGELAYRRPGETD